MEGMAHAGLGDDLLLANEVVDPDRLRRLAALDARVTIAVDSEGTIDAAARAGLGEVVIDVYVGMPRCGCPPDRAGRLADVARSRGLAVRGVMGYEGHVVGVHDRATRVEQTETSMRQLLDAHADVGGELGSGGGTGTFDINTWATEIQAGSYALMDTAYGHLDLPFELALSIVATVISVSDGWAVADCGLKALGMDHGDPTVIGHTVWYCSDEHVTFGPATPVAVGDRVAAAPLDNAQQAELSAAQTRLEDLRIQLNATIGVVLGLAFATTLAAAFLTRRWVTRPLERLAGAVRSARAGRVGVIAPQGP